MLMTDPKLTEHAQSLLDFIRTQGGEWVTRSDLAKHQDKKRLNVWDVKLLSDLAEADLIETRQVDAPGPIGYEWQYRAKGQG